MPAEAQMLSKPIFDFTLFGFQGENIVLTLVSVIIGVVAAFIFYKLQKKDSNSAKQERVRRANDELVETIESVFINKQDITLESIDHLFYACSRKYNVSLKSNCSTTDLLQDVMLRIQRSPHLDIKQKNEYIKKIEEFIENKVAQNIEVKDNDLEGAIAIIDGVIESYDQKDSNDIKDEISSIKSRIINSIETTKTEESRSARWSFISSVTAGVAVSIAIFSINMFNDAIKTKEQREDLKEITLKLRENISEIENSSIDKFNKLEDPDFIIDRDKIATVYEKQKKIIESLINDIEKQKTILSLRGNNIDTNDNLVDTNKVENSKEKAHNK